MRTSAIVATALLALLVGVGAYWGHLASQGSRVATQPRYGAPTRSLSSLPFALQAPVSTAMGADSPAYHVAGTTDRLSATNPAQRLHAIFTRAGAVIDAGGAHLGVGLQGVAAGSEIRPLGSPRFSAAANRVAYAYRGLDAWYANGPLGLEQGFTVSSSHLAQASGALTIALALDGNTRAALSGDGHSATFDASGSTLRYSGLSASDARGHALPSRLVLSGTSLLLKVDTRDARYPVRIDPFFQYGPKIAVAGEESNKGIFGFDVAVSADGNSALIGAPLNNGNTGAVWAFKREGGVWSQVGPKITASGEVGQGYFGWHIAMSPEGTTAAIAGPGDNFNAGAVWVFTRSGETWKQQGSKLTGTGETGAGELGFGTAISSDGNTLIAGGITDNSSVGAAWVFTRSGETWSQQGPKLTGSGETGGGELGYSVALSSDGNTALVGAPTDSSRAGAAFVYTRSGETWTQQGSKLTGSGEIGGGIFGNSVVLSADGNTAAVGAQFDNSNAGAVWIFARSGEAWTQQGSKLTGSGEAGKGEFGYALALTPDANTLLIAGPNDNGNVGSCWVFTRSGETYSQQGPKLTGTGESGAGFFGESVAISSDGNTAIIGVAGDSGALGAFMSFTRSGETWTQQGPKLAPRGDVGTGEQGFSVALSANGNTAIVGGIGFNESEGAAWVFTRTSGVWTEQARLRGEGESGKSRFGFAVALSADGNTALLGGPTDSGNSGAAWVFTRSGEKWSQQGLKLTGGGETGAGLLGWSVALSADGNTALVGGLADNGKGAAWVYTRSGEAWTQQGAKLTGAAEVGAGEFGNTVVLSEDGNTALITAVSDNEKVGATYAFTRSGETWTQQGPKLTATGESGKAEFGFSAALSADGNTALLTGASDNEKAGAAWVFTRSGETWAQQGSKLTGSEEFGKSEFGFSAALSLDGNIAALGGPADNNHVGAAWVFRRSGETWTQVGRKVTASGVSGAGYFGWSIAMTESDTILVGAPGDAGFTGSAIALIDLSVTGVSPNGGTTSGGTSVAITGSDFRNVTAVKFGANAATGYTVNSPTSITATAPEGTGTVDVSVTTAEATSPTTAADRYTYGPVVASVSPNAGPVAGGATVTITGKTLGAATAVMFGANSSPSITVNSSESITAISPAGSAGTVDVTVVTPEGTSPVVPEDHYTYLPLPTITKVKPKLGPAQGGVAVLISGTNFSGATAVKFGAVNASSYTLLSPTAIEAVSPEQAPGTVDIRVTTAGGTSAITTADKFKVTPTITGLAPNAGPVAGGTSVVITGTGFALGKTATAVKFGTTKATSVNCVSSMECTAVSPAHAAGIVEVKVTVNKATAPKTTAAQFTYS